MKRIVLFFIFFSAVLLPLWSTSALKSSEKEELQQILSELKTLNEEQAIIIENSQKRNEELERQSSEQEKQIETLTDLSESKQKIIDEQEITINELKNLSREQRKSSLKAVITSILSSVASFFIGCLAGLLFL